jgi:cysteine desulfurase
VRPIYLDHAASTPLDPRVREAMLPWLDCANPSSLHSEGRKARMAIDESREFVADAIGCLPGELIFTSSGTESANLALVGAAWANRHSPRNRILISAAEHHCVLSARPLLEGLGYSVEETPVTMGGWSDVDALREAASDDVLLVCAMHANNETGAINDTDAIATICRDNGALYLCDAVQSFGIIETATIDADFVTVSGHKIYGPKGVGALMLRAGARIQPMLLGGGQEREMRAGTENVAAIVGFAAAVRFAREDTDRKTRMGAARDSFVHRLRKLVPEAVFPALDTDYSRTLPGHAHLRIPGVDAETTLINLDRLGIAASSGAACSSGSVEPSHVLLAMGMGADEAGEGLRFSFGKDTTTADAAEAAARVAQASARGKS